MSDNTQQTVYATCPFCGLLCDDIELRRSGQQLTAGNPACREARQRFALPLPVARSATIAGREVAVPEAVTEARRLLAAAEAPLFAGLGTDVAGMRALMALAEQYGATLDHMHSEALHRNNLVLQDLGWLNTTLSEIRNRADLVLFVGTDARGYPRFHDRMFCSGPSQFTATLDRRRLVYLGHALNSGLPQNGEHSHRTEIFSCPDTHLAECLAVLRTLVQGRPVTEQDNAQKLPLADLKKLAEWLLSAQYGVIVWSAGDLDFPHAELTIQAICELVKDVNLHGRRCAGFSLGGTDGAGTANSVCGWQSGYPLRVSFARGYPHYDAHAQGMQALIDSGSADVLLWVSSFNHETHPPDSALPTVILARPDYHPRRPPEVFLPVGTPGVDHAGYMFRTDGVVSLPLGKLRESNYPSVAEQIRQLAGEH